MLQALSVFQAGPDSNFVAQGGNPNLDKNSDKFSHVFSSCRATCPSSPGKLGQGTWTTAGCRVTRSLSITPRGRPTTWPRTNPNLNKNLDKKLGQGVFLLQRHLSRYGQFQMAPQLPALLATSVPVPSRLHEALPHPQAPPPESTQHSTGCFPAAWYLRRNAQTTANKHGSKSHCSSHQIRHTRQATAQATKKQNLIAWSEAARSRPCSKTEAGSRLAFRSPTGCVTRFDRRHRSNHFGENYVNMFEDLSRATSRTDNGEVTWRLTRK